MVFTLFIVLFEDSCVVNFYFYTTVESHLAIRPTLPIISSRQLAFPAKFKVPRQVWISNMDTVEEEKLGLIDLHPEVFAERPRVDIIHENVRWQQLYRYVVRITLATHHI